MISLEKKSRCFQPKSLLYMSVESAGGLGLQSGLRGRGSQSGRPDPCLFGIRGQQVESASESKVRRTEPFLFLVFIATPLFRWNHCYKNSAYCQNTLLRPGRTKEAPQSPGDSVGFSPLLNTELLYLRRPAPHIPSTPMGIQQ